MAYMITPISHVMLFCYGQSCFTPPNQGEEPRWPEGMTTWEGAALEFWVLPVLLFCSLCTVLQFTYLPWLIHKKCLKAKFLQVLFPFMQ